MSIPYCPGDTKLDKENLYQSLRTLIGARVALPKDAKHDFYAQMSEQLSPQDLWAEAILIVGAGTHITGPLFAETHTTR